MQDILVYLFPFADINTKSSLLLVNKELNKYKFNDLIDDEISQHIFINKGYFNLELYIKIRDNINFIQEYDKDFNINNIRLIISDNRLNNIDLTGLINLQKIFLRNNKLQNIDLTGLINLQYLDISNNNLTLKHIKYIKELNILYYYF